MIKAEPKGLGYAISHAKTFVENESFAVMFMDDIVDSEVPCLKQLIDCFDKFKTSILAVQAVCETQVFKYGIVKGVKIEDKVYKVKDLIEKRN